MSLKNPKFKDIYFLEDFSEHLKPHMASPRTSRI